jgi:putative ABC transport system permease protein
MRGLLQTLRHTIRLLFKSPGFSITVVAVLGLGIGVNVAVFSLIDTVLLTPLPYPASDRLVQIFMPVEGNPSMILDYPDYVDLSVGVRCLDGISVVRPEYLDLTGNERAERLKVNFVSASIFEVTRIPFLLGRPFTQLEDVPNGPSVVVISELFWRSRFNSDPKIIGSSLVLSGHSFQIIGVVPAQADLWGPPRTDVYLPVNFLTTYGYGLLDRRQHLLMCIGRLKDAVSLRQAQADLKAVHASLITRYPETDKGYGIKAVPLLQSVSGDSSQTIWLLGCAAACVLLIAVANIANLLFVRWLQRKKEMIIRATIGASRLHLIWQLLLETGFLTALGGIVGLFLSLWAIGIVRALGPDDRLRFQEVGFDARALLFVLFLTIFVALLAGFLPAWSLSKTNLAAMLRDEGSRVSTSSAHRQRTQSVLIIGQIALACVLLICASLLIRSFQAEQSVSLGFDPHNVLTAEIYLTDAKYGDFVRARTFFDRVLENVRRLPGVVDAAMDEDLPFNWSQNYADPFSIPGAVPAEPGHEPRLDTQRVSSGFFRTLGIPLVAGRDFDARDTAHSERVVIIDRSLAERFFAGQDPIGKQIYDLGSFDDQAACTIIGVAGHVLHNEPGHQQALLQAYYPYSQRRIGYEMLVVRSRMDPTTLTSSIRSAVASVDPDVPVTSVRTFDDLIAHKFRQVGMSVLLISVFSAGALFLAAVGLYGVLSYSVSQRKRDIGIRMALGAESWDILSLITKEGFRILLFGLLIGTGGGLGLARLIQGMLYGISAIDGVSVGIAAVVLSLAAFAACVVPALSALRTMPTTVLRE